jgi:hypothetical protein
MKQPTHRFGHKYLIHQEDLVMRRFYEIMKKKVRREQRNKRNRRNLT